MIFKDKEMIECERCDCVVSHLNKSNFQDEDGNDIMVCDICYGSRVGNILQWPEQYSNDAVSVARMIAEVGNMILERMKEVK
jgi:hypothetical protein